MKTVKHFLTLTLLVCLGTFAHAQIPSYVPTNGLVGWWPFNGNANDESGNNFNAIEKGATLTTDRYGIINSAYYFYNSTGGLEVDSFIFIDSNYSVSFWVNTNVPITNQARLISNDWSNCGEFVIYQNNPGTFCFATNQTCSSNVEVNNNILQLNKWYHITGVRNNNNLILYINGAWVSSNINYNINGSAVNKLFFGGDPYQPGGGFWGKIDDIAIYNRALSPAEVQQLYLGNCTQPTFTAQPQNKSVAQGQTTTFAVQVDTTSTFQWQMDNGFGFVNLVNSSLFSGVTTNTLTVKGSNSIDGYSFRCIATACQSDTSNAATLTVTSNASTLGSVAGVPGKINYQGAAVDSAGKPLKNQTIALKLSVLDSSSTGAAAYVETHSTPTNGNGLFSLQIGGGTAVTGTFDSIPWANGNDKFLKVEMDAQGGSNYQNMGSTQLVSVPYALHAGSAKRAEEVMDGMTKYKHYIGELFEGGIIFHLYKDSLGIEHGLIASLNDVSNGSIWSNINSLVAPTNGLPPQMSPQNGSLNTNLIVGQNGHVNSAASICKQYRGGGFSDWYLPAVWELQILYQSAYLIEKVLGPAGKFSFSDYWSSTEEFNSIAWAVSFSVGNSSGSHNKSQLFKVRAIRSF